MVVGSDITRKNITSEQFGFRGSSLELAGNGGSPVAPTRVMDMVVSMIGTIGDDVDETVVDAGTHGTSLGTVSMLGPGATTRLKLAAPAGTPMAVPLQVGDVIYDGTTNKSFQFDCDNPLPADPNTAWRGIRWTTTPATITNLLSVWHGRLSNTQAAVPGTPSVNNDLIEAAGDRGFAIIQQIRSNAPNENILHGHSDAELGNLIEVPSTSTDYTIEHYYNDTLSMGETLFLQGNVVLGATDSLMAGLTGFLARLDVKNYLQNVGGLITVYVFGAKWTSPVFPSAASSLEDFPVTSVVLAQTNIDELTVTFNSQVTRFTLDFSTNAGVDWTNLETYFRIKTTTPAKSYVFAATNGLTYRVRGRAEVGVAQASYVSSNDVLVDNAGLHLTWGVTPSGGSGASDFDAGAGRGCRIVIGAFDQLVVELGGYFTADAFSDIEVEIKTGTPGSLTTVASVTIPFTVAGIGEVFEPLAVSFNMLAGGTYYIVAINPTYILNPTMAVNTSMATRVYGCDEEGNDLTGDGIASTVAAVNYKT